MKSFKEIRFPEDISYGSSGGPGYSTDVISISSGHEQRNINWNDARCKYNIVHGIKDQEQLNRLISFFRIVKGKAYGFRFKDWSDYRAENQIIALGDGVSKEFQLVKFYDVDNLYTIRIIKKPVKDSVKIYLDNQICNDVNIDYDNGMISFVQPIVKDVLINADFEFDTPARFDTDNISAVIDNYGVYSFYNIAIIEIKI